jgi:mRNA interferase MazF
MNTPYRADIYYIDLGTVPQQVVGREQGNTRPCVVIQTLDYSELAVIVPITSKLPPHQIYSIVKILQGNGGLTSDSFALCHQIRTVSYQRIIKRIGTLPIHDFNKILTVLADFLDV